MDLLVCTQVPGTSVQYRRRGIVRHLRTGPGIRSRKRCARSRSGHVTIYA